MHLYYVSSVYVCNINVKCSGIYIYIYIGTHPAKGAHVYHYSFQQGFR